MCLRNMASSGGTAGKTPFSQWIKEDLFVQFEGREVLWHYWHRYVYTGTGACPHTHILSEPVHHLLDLHQDLYFAMKKLEGWTTKWVLFSVLQNESVVCSNSVYIQNFYTFPLPVIHIGLNEVIAFLFLNLSQGMVALKLVYTLHSLLMEGEIEKLEPSW